MVIQHLFQSTPFSCGPCAALMCRSYFEEYTPSIQDESSLFEKTSPDLDYTTHPQLAMYLMNIGYETTLMHEHETCFSRGNLPQEQFQKRMQHYYTHKKSAENKGMKTKIDFFNANSIAELVSQKDTAAIILTKISEYSPIFHHILAYDATEESVQIADSNDGLRTIHISALDKKMSLPNGKGALIVKKKQVI